MFRGRQPADIDGDESLGIGDAVGAVADLADLEALEHQLAQEYALGSGLDDVDVDTLERQLPGSSVRELRGAARAGARAGAPGLPPVRRRRAVADPEGAAAARRDGAAPDLPAARRRRLRLRTTTRGPAAPTSAPARSCRGSSATSVRSTRSGRSRTPCCAGPGSGTPAAVRSAASGSTSRTSRWPRPSGAPAPRSPCCVDLSFSMVQEGRWGPMKQTALALSHLIQTRFRQDALQIIGFDRTARPLTPLQLAEVEPEWVQGTNLHHALLLAGRHLRRHPEAEPVVLVVTDGEPTAHLEADGLPVFHWPTTPTRSRATVGEVDALTRYGRRAELLPARRRPGSGPVRRRGRAAQRRSRLHPRRRPARRVRRRRLPARPLRRAPLRLTGASPKPARQPATYVMLHVRPHRS